MRHSLLALARPNRPGGLVSPGDRVLCARSVSRAGDRLRRPGQMHANKFESSISDRWFAKKKIQGAKGTRRTSVDPVTVQRPVNGSEHANGYEFLMGRRNPDGGPLGQHRVDTVAD